MNGNTQQLFDSGLLSLESLPSPASDARLAVTSSGTASLMINPTDSKLAFCPAASSEVVVLDLYSGSRSSSWAALGRDLDSHTSTQGSLVETSWAADGTALLRTCDGSICAVTEEGSLLWHWPGVNVSERTVHAVWLGESTVAALTTAGKIYTLPKQTGAPVADFMKRLTALHRYFRCMAYDKSESRLVVVGEDGSAHKAKTSQQLAAALSVSVWDISNLRQPLLVCTAGSKQGLIHRGMSPRNMQQGWGLALHPTHLAVTLPTCVATVYKFQGSGGHMQLSPLLSLGNAVTPNQTPPAAKGGQPLGDSLLQCSSNAIWWAPDQLAFVGPDGCLQVVQVPSGEVIMYVDSHYFLPGSRIVASLGVHGRARSVFVLSALMQAARPLGRKAKKSTAPTVMRRWMVVRITQLSPYDKLTSLISQRQWQAALELAAQHRLSTDDVYKSQWLAEASSACVVPGQLANIADRAWAVQQCLSHSTDEHSRQQGLLHYGLQLTAQHCHLDNLTACAQGEVDLGADAAPWWLLQRCLLLEQLDALDTFMALVHRQFSGASYREFRQHTLQEAAMAAARNGSFTKLQLLCERHPHRLVPGMLTLLACVPETASHEVYSNLLSLVADFDNSVQRALLLREGDWVESEAMTSLAVSLGEPAAASATEQLAAHRAQRPLPPTAQEVAAWLTQRAQAVEEMTGQLHTAAQLLRLAHQFEPDDALARHLSTVASLQDGLQEGAIDCESWGLSLSQFTQLSPREQVLLMVPEGNAAPDGAAATAHRVAKLIAVTVQPEGRQQLLMGLVQEDAPRHLPWCVHIFERLRLQRQVFASRGHLAACALACAYACDLPFMWAPLLAIVQAGTAALEGFQTLEQAQQHLADDLHKAEGQCRAGQLLAGLGLDISLPGLRAATPAAAKDLLTFLLTKLADTVPPLSESRWLEVGEEVLEAARAGLPGLGEQEVQAQLCFALLCSARFNLAKTYLTGSQALPNEAARGVVLQAAQAFFQSASSLEAEEIGLGQITLGLLPHDPEVQQQGSCLQALQELQDYGLQILPAQYNEVEDKMQLLKSAVNLSDKAYKRPEAVQHLAGLLGLSGRSSEVSMCIGAAALQHKDIQAAQRICLQLIRRDHASAWRVCAAVMRSGGDEVGSTDTHIKLLSFAAHYCPARRLEGILAHLRLIKQGLHHSALSPQLSPSPQSSQSSSPTAVSRHQRTTLPAPCASPERMQGILRAAVDAPLPLEVQGRALPGFGDSQMGVGCLMHLGNEAWELLQGMVDSAPSPRHARRALLMGLQASALKVLIAQEFEGSLQEQSQQARALWGSAPWTLADQCSKLSCEELEPELQQAQEWCMRFARQLHSQKDTLQIKEALPETDLQLFTGSSSASEGFRADELTRLVTEAGQVEDVALGQGRLEQALALADKYSSPKWDLVFTYTSSLLLTWQHQTEVVVPVVRQIFPALMQKPSATVHQLLLITWPQLQGQRKLHVGFCLKMLEMCFKHVLTQEEQAHSGSPALGLPEAAIQRLVQLQSFARGMAPTAAGLDIKPFLAQCLPAQLLVLVVNSTGQQVNGSAEAVGAGRNLSAADTSAVLAGLRLAAVEELCLHCNSSNVQEVADLLQELPSPTVLSINSKPSVYSMAEAEFEFKLSSSTAYTAAACACLLEVAGLPQGEPHPGACQEAAGYLQSLAAPHLQKLLLWCTLDGVHPLLPSGPQLPEQLAADVRLALLQTGLEVLLRHAKAGVQIEEDGRLQMEANRLDALCAVHQSCNLSSEQWSMVERALEAITAAASEECDDGAAAVVKACVGELVASGLAIQDVLSASERLQELVAVMDEEEQSKPQAAEVISTVVQQQMADCLAALSSFSGQLSSSMLALDSAPSSDEDGRSERYKNGVEQHDGDSAASGDQAVSIILGVLQSLQSSGTSAQAHQLVTNLRHHVWTALQHHLFSRQDLSESSSLQPDQLQLLEAVLTLFTSQSGWEEPATRPSPGSPEKGDKLPVIQWQGWSPGEVDSSSRVQGQQMLLVSRSRAIASRLWPEVPLGRKDLADHSAAQKLFFKLLEAADGVEQLQGLRGLLEDVWLNGDAIPSHDQEADGGSQDSRPLHACWSALLQRMLKADQTALVLRVLDTASASASAGPAHRAPALLMPHEAHQLVDTARSLTHQGAAASIALLQTDTALVDGALHDLADRAITDTVKPDLFLLSILLQKGLFERVAGGLQAQLIKCLSADPTPPPMFSADSQCSPALHDIADTRTTLLPATISLLTGEGYYAQAAALCVFHTQLHPAFSSFEPGMQYLYPYLIAHQQLLASDSELKCNVVESWPLPSTLSELQKSLPVLLAAGIDRIRHDNYIDYF